MNFHLKKGILSEVSEKTPVAFCQVRNSLKIIEYLLGTLANVRF